LPATRRDDIVEDHFGITVADPYRWLENPADPAVKDWTSLQDGVARDYLKRLPGRDALKKRFTELFARDVTYPDQQFGKRAFFTRRFADRDMPVVYWKKGKRGKERVLLDPATMSADGKTTLGFWRPNNDGTKVVFALHPNNSDDAILYVKDVKSGETSEIDVIPGARYASPVWNLSGTGFYYTALPVGEDIPADEMPGHAHVRFHRLGTDPKTDAVIYPKLLDPKTFLHPSLSNDGRFLFITVSRGWGRNSVLYRDLQAGGNSFRFLYHGEAEVSPVGIQDGFLYLKTSDGAVRSRLFRAPVDDLQREHWQLVVPEHPSAVLKDAEIWHGKLVLHDMENVASRLEIRGLDGTLLHDVKLPSLGVVTQISESSGAGDKVTVTFQSLLQPPVNYDLSLSDGSLTGPQAPSDFPVDPSKFDIEQVWYDSKDGTRVPMFLVRKKGTPRDGKTPFILYGYGGFNLSMDPNFRSSIYPWLEAGGGYAIANIRGGGEFGEAWHEAGKRENKQNVFDDFISGARFLIEQGYTSPDRLAAEGGSNGGLLMGAMLTQAADTFRTIVCGVPLLDMVRYHMFGSGKTWVPEYGDPDAEGDFKFIYDYSPYHHAAPGHYPSTLFMGAADDDRVDPMHARKMAAAVQWANVGPNPVLLRVEANAGHGGGGRVSADIESYADKYAFLMNETGLGAG
jgi:prolyl oligopeptidase